MSTDTVTNDLDYLRTLAESGRAAAPLGGRFLTWWGGLLSFAYLGHFLIASDRLGLPPSAFAWLWIGFGVVGYTGHALLRQIRIRSKPGENAVGNRVERTIWRAAGAALLGYFLALALKSVLTGQPAAGFAFSLPLVFAAYGIAMLTTGVMAESRILQRAGSAALVLVALNALTTGLGYEWLIASAGMALTALLPGILLLRQEPAEIAQTDEG